MTIPEIKITDAEMVSAVQSFLEANGISVLVKSVDKNYRGSGSWLVTLKDPDEPAPIKPPFPTPETPETPAT